MAAETKIRVDKAKLIGAIRTRRSEAESAHIRSFDGYQERLDRWQAKAREVIASALERIEAGESFGYYHFQDLGSAPSQPTDFDGTKYDRHIAMLEMSPDDTISVNTSDFGAYLR